MSELQFIALVLLLALATALTRFLPFLIFGKKGKSPMIIDYLGLVLPAAMMGLLVVYCFKDTDIGAMHELLPALAASASVVGVHLWKRNTALSIVLGTAVYMVLLRVL